ncbi:DUF5372 family protein [Candidatus Megaera polyxenophila]|uniref:DUF5372 family protein n=1 Tax=Candidatus Megaera polyxenophila TaxID=988779 RepID=UPI003977E3E4
MTHPFHPLKGKKFALITIRYIWGEKRAYYYDEDAVLKALPLCWTDLIPQKIPILLLLIGEYHFV